MPPDPPALSAPAPGDDAPVVATDVARDLACPRDFRTRGFNVTAMEPLVGTLRDIWRRSSSVSERDIATYEPRAIDIAISEALSIGASSLDELAEFASMPRARIAEAFRDPVATAWISRVAGAHIQHRVGLVDAALFSRAIGGDIQAMRLYFERFKTYRREMTVNHVVHDYDQMSDQDLSRVLRDKLQGVQDADFTVPGEDTPEPPRALPAPPPPPSSSPA